MGTKTTETTKGDRTGPHSLSVVRAVPWSACAGNLTGKKRDDDGNRSAGTPRACCDPYRPAATNSDPLENLLAALDLVRQHGSPGLAAWFSGAIEAYLEGGRLEDCLSLSAQPFQRTARTRHQHQLRAKHLTEAWGAVSREPIGPWTRGRKLAGEIAKFQVNAWPEWQHVEEPPPEATTVQGALFYAAKCGKRLPTSPKQLVRICDQHRKQMDTTSPILCPWPDPRDNSKQR